MMPPLTRAADHSKLWFAIAAAIVGRRPVERSAARRAGWSSLAVTSLFTNQVAKRVWRSADDRLRIRATARRRTRRRPTSNSLPSGHSASAAAFAVGVGLENPPLGLRAGVAGRAWSGLSRVATGRTIPVTCRRLRYRRGDRRAGCAGGAADRGEPGFRQPIRCGWTPEPRPDGAGVVLVVNPCIRQRTGARVIDEVARALAAGPRSSSWAMPTTSKETLRYGGRPGRGACRRRRRRDGVMCGRGGGRSGCPAGGLSRLARSTTSPRTSAATRVGKTVEAIRDGQCRLRRPRLPQRRPLGDQHREHRRISGVRPDPREARAPDQQAAGGPLRDAAHAAPRRAGAHRLRQQDAADLAVLSRQFDVSAIGVRAVAADPDG